MTYRANVENRTAINEVIKTARLLSRGSEPIYIMSNKKAVKISYREDLAENKTKGYFRVMILENGNVVEA